MVSFLFDLMSACAHFLWDALTALLGFGWKLLGAAATVISWPARAVLGLLHGTLSWTPLFLFVCIILAAVLLIVTVTTVLLRPGRFK